MYIYISWPFYEGVGVFGCLHHSPFPFKVLLLCMSAITVCSTDAPLVAMVTELVGRLVSIPSQVYARGCVVVVRQSFLLGCAV